MHVLVYQVQYKIVIGFYGIVWQKWSMKAKHISCEIKSLFTLSTLLMNSNRNAPKWLTVYYISGVDSDDI